MCGIFGMISKKARPFNKRAFCTMGVRNDSRGGDSCGIFIDGNVEYGVDKEKLFISFFRKSALLNVTTQCKIALGHCRKASVGKVSLETAQPVVIHNEEGQIDFVLIHNGTIYNYKDLAKKYIPDVNIEGLTDSQVMARIFYHAGYDALDEYNGGAVFVIHDYRNNQSYIFKGASKKYKYSKDIEEERPLYFCWHNGRFVFSSIFETLYAFYYEETIYCFPVNKLMSIKENGKCKLVKAYNRTECTQSKPTVTYGTLPSVNGCLWDEYDSYYTSEEYKANREYYRLKFDGITYNDNKDVPLHGTFFVTTGGFVYPNKKSADSWLHEVGFFQGRLLKHPKAFKLINDLFHKNNNVLTPELETLINILDFNPYTDDFKQYYWYDADGNWFIPQQEWRWPMADFSIVFNKEGIVVNTGKVPYHNWTTDYKMYTYDEDTILEYWKKLCEGE